jgi:hypothetical protein
MAELKASTRKAALTTTARRSRLDAHSLAPKTEGIR